MEWSSPRYKFITRFDTCCRYVIICAIWVPAWYLSVVLPSYQSLTPGFMETGFLAMTQSKWVVVVLLLKLTIGMFRAISKGKSDQSIDRGNLLLYKHKTLSVSLLLFLLFVWHLVVLNITGVVKRQSWLIVSSYWLPLKPLLSSLAPIKPCPTTIYVSTTLTSTSYSRELFPMNCVLMYTRFMFQQ